MRHSQTTTMLAITVLLATACGDDGTGDDGAATTAASDGGTGDATATTAPESATDTGTPATSADTTDGGASTGDADTTDGGADSSGDTGVAMCPDLGDPCTQCESTMCPDEYCGCFDNGSCGLLVQCGLACDLNDQDCYQQCWTMYPEGISDAGLLTHCAGTLCLAECGAYEPLSQCQLCLYADCPDEMNVCISNPECTALLECLDACEDPGCENGCYALHPDGLADSGPVGECAQRACLTECA